MTWTIQELMNYVYFETNRPDLIDETRSAVISAIMKLHNLDFWHRDRTQATVVFDFSAYIQVLDLTVLPRYRALSFVRKWDPTFSQSQLNPGYMPPVSNNQYGQSVNVNAALAFITIIDPDDIFDDYKTERVDVAYVAGSDLNIKSSTAFQQAKIGWYQYPNLDMINNYSAFSSWIADNHPFAVIYTAAQIVSRKIGDTEVAASYGDTGKGLIGDEVVALRVTGTTAVGR